MGTLYSDYVEQVLAAREASTQTRAMYTALVRAINAGSVKLDFNYQGLIVSHIWAGKSRAWRPRPLDEFNVVTPVPAPSIPPADIAYENPDELVARYYAWQRIESDAWSLANTAYERLVTAYQRGELANEDSANISRTPAFQDGYAKFPDLGPSTVRIYEVKPPKK